MYRRIIPGSYVFLMYNLCIMMIVLMISLSLVVDSRWGRTNKDYIVWIILSLSYSDNCVYLNSHLWYYLKYKCFGRASLWTILICYGRVVSDMVARVMVYYIVSMENNWKVLKYYIPYLFKVALLESDTWTSYKKN